MSTTTRITARVSVRFSNVCERNWLRTIEASGGSQPPDRGRHRVTLQAEGRRDLPRSRRRNLCWRRHTVPEYRWSFEYVKWRNGTPLNRSRRAYEARDAMRCSAGASSRNRSEHDASCCFNSERSPVSRKSTLTGVLPLLIGARRNRTERFKLEPPDTVLFARVLSQIA